MPAWLLLTVTALFISACGSAGSDEEFRSFLDTDIGQGSGDTGGNGNGQSGDPCLAESPWSCNPVTSEGCEGTEVSCNWGQKNYEWGFWCFSPATQSAGENCDTANGPWCGIDEVSGIGTTCHIEGDGTTGACALYCCGQSDCDSGQTCIPLELENVTGDIGYCSGSGQIPDAGADAG